MLRRRPLDCASLWLVLLGIFSSGLSAAGAPPGAGRAAEAGGPEEPVTLLVRDGTPVAEIWHGPDGEEAAREIATYVERISGAKLPLRLSASGELQGKQPGEQPGEVPAQPPDGAPAAIVVGNPALRAGMPAPPPTPSGDGYRLLARGNRVLLGGETRESTFFAACHLLEALGCRWFFDNPLGEVVPRTKTVLVVPLDVEEEPDFISRSLWGPNWRSARWARRNRLGGLSLPTGHDWGHVPASRYGDEHPEYYALRGGERRPGAWLCTSNEDVRRIFAESVAGAVRGDEAVGVSISPPDGNGYCECERCAAEDVPGHIEPSSGRLAMTDRYLKFFNAVAAEAHEANPRAILGFYAYADYSLPPRSVTSAAPNLCAWIAPIRFCRFHGLSNPRCESRRRCREVVEGWARVVPRIGWREYNYNLAEATVPLSKISVWREDIPYLKRIGCLGLNIECLALWHLYGPHTYLIARLAWDADADVDAILADFYERLGGKAAAPLRAYWERIDAAYRDAPAHAGSFYALHAVWTPELVAACRSDLEAAADRADDETIARRVDMFRRGLASAELYLALREATNRCDFPRAREIYRTWISEMDATHGAAIHPVAEYRRGYAPRFLEPAIAEGYERVTAPRRLILRLPDEWLFRAEAPYVARAASEAGGAKAEKETNEPKEADEGEALGWMRPDLGEEGWRRVRTYSATLDEQGVPETLTWLWYRTRFPVPPDLPEGHLHIWFGEIDGNGGKVFLNGEHVGDLRGGRRPEELDIAGRLLAGKENVVAVKIDHRRISELHLGGILRPVMIYAGPWPGS